MTTVSDELRDRAIQIMKTEGSFSKFKRFLQKGKQEQAIEMVEYIIARHNLNR